jgi:hypothetical protein
MDIIEIEECLGELRKQIKDTTEELTDAKVLICKAQNIIQKWIEQNKPRSEWKHTRTTLSQSLF